MNPLTVSLPMANEKDIMGMKTHTCAKGKIKDDSCEKCETQGIMYLFNGKTSFKMKAFRSIVVLLASIGMFYVCYLSSSRYFRCLTQTVVERTDVHVSEIPFPAITLCPVKSVTRKLVEEAVHRFLRNNSTPQQVDTLERIMRNFSRMIVTDNEDDMSAIRQRFTWAQLDYVNIKDLMWFLSYECEEFFEECHWRRVRYNCCSLFRRQKAFEAACFSFNSKTTEDPDPTWPWRVSESGKLSGLRVTLKTHNYTNNLQSDLIALIVNDPDEEPSTNIIYVGAQRVAVVLDPLRFISDPDIKPLDPKFRRCYFQDEHSKRSCINDCRQAYFEAQCHCTPPWFLKKNRRYCEIPDFECIFNHKHAMITNGKIINPYVNSTDAKLFDCQCYPNCNYVQYKTSVHTEPSGAQQNNSIEIQISFQHDTLFSYRTGLVFTLLDLIVSFGGVAGLFLGFSMVGIVDTCENLYRTRKVNKVEKKEKPAMEKSGSSEKFTNIPDSPSLINVKFKVSK